MLDLTPFKGAADLQQVKGNYGGGTELYDVLLELQEAVSMVTEEYNGTITGDNSVTTAFTGQFRLCSIRIHYSTSQTDDAFVTIDSINGVNYDTIITTFDNADTVTHNYASYGYGDVFEDGDQVKVAVNAAGTAYITIVVEII